MLRPTDIGRCSLCGRRAEPTLHQLIPREGRRRNLIRRHIDCAALQERGEIRRPCHKGPHPLFDEMTLAGQLNALASRRADPAIQRHVRWLHKQHAPIATA